jgi:hypothetical protein
MCILLLGIDNEKASVSPGNSMEGLSVCGGGGGGNKVVMSVMRYTFHQDLSLDLAV